MRYHVVYEPGEINYLGSNTSKDLFWLKDVEDLLNQPNTNVITWQLNELPLTKKFINLYKTRMHSAMLWHYQGNKDFFFNYIYDIYRSVNEKNLLESRAEMNKIIDNLNTRNDIWFTIPEELKLNETDVFDPREKNLNELHDHFETRMVELEDKTKQGLIHSSLSEELWNKLQSINLLVHFNENPPIDKQNNFLAENEWFFTSLKFESPTHNDTMLEAEDYRDFTLERDYGPLQLDFGTVGKDLFTCSVTDDIELVHKNMVSQQIELNPWVQYDWTRCTKTEWEDALDLYDRWITENNVSEYLDLNKDMYRPGRHQLGTCISHSFKSPTEFVDEIISTTPKINSFFITDDNNKTIL